MPNKVGWEESVECQKGPVTVRTPLLTLIIHTEMPHIWTLGGDNYLKAQLKHKFYLAVLEMIG